MVEVFSGRVYRQADQVPGVGVSGLHRVYDSWAIRDSKKIVVTLLRLIDNRR